MSHSLHRHGDVRSLGDDWVVLAMSAKGINKDGSAVRLRRFLEIAAGFGPVNWGDMRQGSMCSFDRKDILAGLKDDSIVHAVFSDEKKLTLFLDRLNKEDLGLSVVASGLFDGLRKAAEIVGLRPHTAAMSLGIWGNKEKLPPDEVLEVTTMCGHGLVSPALVEKLAGCVRQGRMASEEAARILARPCVCGIFNPKRAARLLEEMSSSPGTGDRRDRS